MEDGFPSVSASGPVGSRFISQNDLEEAKARRDEQWKAAYARCAADTALTQSTMTHEAILGSDRFLRHSLRKIHSMVEV